MWFSDRFPSGIHSGGGEYIIHVGCCPKQYHRAVHVQEVHDIHKSEPKMVIFTHNVDSAKLR